MPSLRGSIIISKRIRQHHVWQREPYNYAQAWVDLVLLANDAPRTITIHGEAIALERGQLAWSMRTLEKEWQRSAEWITRFLKFCQDETMITVDANRRRTIISVINYDTYNTLSTDTEPDTEPDKKGETGIGSRKGEGNPPANAGFVEVPPESEVLEFATAYPGDIARGIPSPIPGTWALDWFRYKVGAQALPKKWREKMAADFQRDWLAGHPKARSLRTATLPGGGKGPDGRTAAQARFELSRELEEVQERLDAAYDSGCQADAKDAAREKELKKLIRELGAK